MRESFIFYRSFYEAIKELPRDIQGEIYTAIMEYSLYGKETDNLKPIARSILALIKPQIDVNQKRYENGCKGSEHGKKGGRKPNKETPNEPQANPKRTPKKPQTNPKLTPNDNVNYNVNDISSNSSELLCETSQPHAEHIDYKALIDFFNSQTKGVFGIVQQNISEKRKGLIRARIREHGKETFAQAIEKAYKSDYLKSGKFNCTFDWIIRPTNFEKIISGNYDNKDRNNHSEQGIGDDLTRNVLEGLARAEFEKQQR